MNKIMKTSRARIIMASLALCSAGLLGAAVPAAYEETFGETPDDTPLTAISGWAPHGKEASPVPRILNAAGYEGAGVRFSAAGLYQRALPKPLPLDGGGLEFRAKLRVSAARDAYCHASIMIGQNGGVYGFQLQFEGGNIDGKKDNSIQILSGGERWGAGKWENLEQARWQKDVWYEVVIHNIRRDEAGEGVSATLTIVELSETPTKLVDAHPIKSTGTYTRAFSRLDTLLVGQRGTAATRFDLDDLSLARQTGR